MGLDEARERDEVGDVQDGRVPGDLDVAGGADGGDAPALDDDDSVLDRVAGVRDDLPGLDGGLLDLGRREGGVGAGSEQRRARRGRGTSG